MSGGTAYVLDLHETRVNSEMVDLETLDAEDVDLVRHLVGRHVEHTGSAVGAALLEDWADSRPAGSPRSCRATTRTC